MLTDEGPTDEDRSQKLTLSLSDRRAKNGGQREGSATECCNFAVTHRMVLTGWYTLEVYINVRHFQ